MAISVDLNGKIVFDNCDTQDCPVDPQEALQCDSCQ